MGKTQKPVRWTLNWAIRYKRVKRLTISSFITILSALSVVSLRKIAERVGCSRSTVSYALRNSPNISRELREKILKVAEVQRSIHLGGVWMDNPDGEGPAPGKAGGSGTEEVRALS